MKATHNKKTGKIKFIVKKGKDADDLKSHKKDCDCGKH